mmetsp:Transcript_62828/g.182281  ORF Transcript_62828/g.182281 Transcript_62828/m.182281 type:complete len:245 (+) Transcript_62828:217-951(+)
MTTPLRPASSKSSSCHSMVACASTAERNKSRATTWTDPSLCSRFGSKPSSVAPLPPEGDMGLRKFRGAEGLPTGSRGRTLSNHASNQARRSSLVAPSGGPPWNRCSSPRTLPVERRSLSSNCLLKRQYRNSAASAKVRPERSAKAAYAFQKDARSLNPSKGPGINSSSEPHTSPPPRRTIMQDKLSWEPRSRARWQTAAAAAPGSIRRLLSSCAAKRTTSRFGNLPSVMPSHTNTRKSLASHSK